MPKQFLDSGAFVAAVNAEMQRLIDADGPTGVWTLTRQNRDKLSELGLDADKDFGHLSPSKPIRIVAVGEGSNTCPCGGTHIKRTSDLVSVTLTKVKVQKGKTKVSYVVG